MPYSSVVDLMLILTRGDEVLLSQRQGTGYADGMWNVPSGKLEDNENAADGLVREAIEEIGLQLQPDELRLAGVVHCRNPERQGRLGLFFALEHQPNQHGQPYNAEPDKCAKIAWFPLAMLPTNTVPYTTAGLDLYQRSEPFTTLGWDAPPW